jgi:TctA family transporter
MVEENFRRALQLSHGDLGTFISRPISATFIAISAFLIVFQVGVHFYKSFRRITPEPAEAPAPSAS